MEPRTLGELFAATFGIQLNTAMWIAILAGGVAWAVSKWLEGSLSKRNAIEIERLKADLDAQVRQTQVLLDTSTHVRRAQFEVEFGAYQEIWEALSCLRKALKGIMTNPDVSNYEGPDPELYVWNHWGKALSALRLANRDLLNRLDIKLPFYSKDKATSVQSLYQSSDSASDQIEVDWMVEDYFFRVDASKYSHLGREIDSIEADIRSRVAEMGTS